MTKSLSKAIALATLVGAAASAQAAPTDVVVNPNGLGEVLLYSLYTAEEGNITNINITNTTDVAKAVKVRFLEGQNSQEVLDFNLYLSPRDQWSGAVTATADGAMLVSADKSCTAPAIPATGEAFRSTDYIGDGGEQSLARTRVGHFEVIEMGAVDTSTFFGQQLFAAVKAGSQPGLAPADCGFINQAFAKDGAWSVKVTDALTAGALQAGLNATNKGGLYGSASILNIEGSTQISYDAVAVDNFKTNTLHTTPGSIYPTLNGALFAGDIAQRTTAKGVWSAATPEVLNTSTVGSLTLELGRTEINNDYVLDAARGSETNWVVTYPTKRFHVDRTMPDGLAAKATPFANKVLARGPFDQFWNTNAAPGESCDTVYLNAWDNEEYIKANIDFSPSNSPVGPQFCYETNILTFNDGKVLGGEFVSNNVILEQPDFQFGWMNIDFTTATKPTKSMPAIGFSAVVVKNNNTSNGLNNNYGSSTNHKTK